jgi:diguanylate cyclase (GGDEF)-like protein
MGKFFGASAWLGARRDPRRVIPLHALLAVLLVVAIVEGHYDWHVQALLITGALAAISDLMFVESGTAGIKISGSALGIMLAAVLLGGGPAAVIGMTTIAIGWVRSREAGHYFRNNLLTFGWVFLVVGVLFHLAVRTGHISDDSVAFYLLAFVAYMLSLVLNGLGIVGYQCYLDGSSLVRKTREALWPLFSADLFSAVLTMATLYITIQLGTMGLLLDALVLLVFQYLAGELIKSKHRSQTLHRLATTDELTGLVNREHFRERLQAEVDGATGATAFAVMLMDLDHFKEINDTLGHHYGDVLLRELGPRLAEAVGTDGLVARLGGDEFAVLSGMRSADPGRLELAARELLVCLQQPFAIDELTLEVTASVGIARFPEDGRDPHTLLRCADVAMYEAKAKQAGTSLYRPSHDNHSTRRLTVFTDFRRALAADEIVVHYQPIVDVNDLGVRGAEGLVRWEHPQLGLLAPGAFVSAVEQTGLIGPMTRHVLERAIAQCAAWRAEGRELSVAVNLSARNLLDRDLLREIERMLHAYGLPPDALKLEITESMLMADPDRARTTVTGLSDLGVSISVDDFGTGYSSLANLRRLPIDELKIDRSFVTPMLRDESDLIIVRSTINLAHDLGLGIIAEGVEDQLTLARLAHLGCDLAQGFHLSKPLPAAEFAAWMAAKETTADDELAA